MMNETVIALIGSIVVAICSVVATIYSNRKSDAIHDVEFRNLKEDYNDLKEDFRDLKSKVEKHNNLIERVSVLENDIKYINDKMEDKK